MSNQDYEIKKDQYVAFDALTIKEHIKNRLNSGGVFTDQLYEGSNISTIVDIVAYTFNVLMYYLNKTSTETMFSDAQLYENMNRIVKLLDYKPIGKQTSTLSFMATANAAVSSGTYTIPRYAYVDVGDIQYSFTKDITFTKETLAVEYLDDMSSKETLFQGIFREYPLATAAGDENEVIYLLPGDDVIIDHFNIHVYIQRAEDPEKWEQWTQTPTLYLKSSEDKVFEVRYNESKHYEIRFGNDINGKKLGTGDMIQIYYLESLGENGAVGARALFDSTLNRYSTKIYDELIQDVIADYGSTVASNPITLSNIAFDNSRASTYFTEEETVDEIRKNAPGNFRSQYRVVTEADYDNYIKTNFSQIIHDVKVVNNWTYVSEYLKYLYDLGLKNPNMDTRTLYNQVMFGDSCNFNNTYAFMVPRTIENKNTFTYLTPAQKELIMYQIKDVKVLTSELLPVDPVYVNTSFLVPAQGVDYSIDDLQKSKLVIVVHSNSRRSNSSIKADVSNIFKTYFSRKNCSLGQEIDINEITKNILAVDGVKTFYTTRTDVENVSYDGLSLVVWNPIYPNDIQVINRNLILPFFKIPFFENLAEIENIIEVTSDSRIYESIEY